jgi:Na+-transporting methylmalonyl-CoA/oxaloacetate decarboxylase gamma subunit
MGKIISIIGGTAAVVIGIILAFFVWSKALVLGIQFMLMFILILGGLIAVVAGISEIKDSMAAKKEDQKQEDKKEEDKKEEDKKEEDKKE